MVLLYHEAVSSQRDGRVAQKERTRRALVDATRRLLAEGLTPTVEQAAAAADVSRTTAYRYFRDQRALLLAAHPEIDDWSLLGEDPPEDVEARLAIAVDALTRLVLETEPQLRTMLRLSLEPGGAESGSLVLRQGRAIGWLEEALSPLRDQLPPDEFRRLVLTIRAACGIEALVWMTDVAGLSRQEAVEMMRWSARALYASATRGLSG